MGRQRAEKIKISPELITRVEQGVVLTREILRVYVEEMRKQGRREDSVRSSEKILEQFYDALPQEKVIGRETLNGWRENLLKDGYAIRTANSKVSLINSLLESMDCRELQVSGQLKPKAHFSPELTRQEYVRMLQTAKGQEDRRSYLLTKLFATTGLAVIDLPKVTAEAVQAGYITLTSGEKTELVRFPTCLRVELAEYAKETGCIRGELFVKRNGEPLARTQVGLYIQRLATDAGVAVEKGNVKCLRQLYKSTISGIEANFDLLVRQAYERQLELEQLSVGWECE